MQTIETAALKRQYSQTELIFWITLVEAPFVIIGDEVFPLKTYLMRPYPGSQSIGNGL